MKFYSKILVVFIVTFVVMSLTSCSNGQVNALKNIQNRGSLIVTTNAEFEPFEYKKNNKIIGIDIDISKEIAKSLDVNLEIQDVSFDALIFELKKHKCDFAIAAISYDEDRSRNVDFSEPYFNASQVAVVMKNSLISSSEDLNNKKVGVHLGTTGDTYCTNRKNLEVVRFNKSMDAISDMINGNIDAVVVDDFTADKLISKNSDKIKKLGMPLTDEEYRIAVPKGDIEILNFINKEISRIKSDGTLDLIVNKYLSLENSNLVYEENEEYKIQVEDNFINQVYINLIENNRYIYIINGLLETLKITLFSVIIGVIIGILIALIKTSSDKNYLLKLFNFLANIYVVVIRGTPLVVQLFIMYYIILASSPSSKSFAAILAFGINSGAYVSEIIRAGIMSVDKGQAEAGRSLGMNSRDVFIKIIFPQALKNVLPAIANEMITLVKETSVAGFIGVVDLSRAGDIIRSQTYEAAIPLFTVAIIYLILVMGFTLLVSKFERRLRRSDIR